MMHTRCSSPWIDYANGTTTHDYDLLTYRLRRLKTTAGLAATGAYDFRATCRGEDAQGPRATSQHWPTGAHQGLGVAGNALKYRCFARTLQPTLAQERHNGRLAS